jgi:crotonobetainyl-CoA:carnitine CoA-transferase CaiB-like acyl-CoA transferase
MSTGPATTGPASTGPVSTGPVSTAPLAGIRILEVGHMLAGPYATMMLADLGAEVTKIESPGGDISRQVGDTYFASLNRGKRSVCIDLGSPAGRARLGELAADAHALVVNLKPSAIRRLGLTYDALRQWNERIVCVALTGFGLAGSDDPAFDYLIQAASGVAALTGDPAGPPTLPGYSSADNSSGLAAALGLLAQIVSGRGGQVDVSMRDVMLSQLNYRAAAYLNDGSEPLRRPLGAHSYYVPAQLFPTADGYLALFVTHDEFWKSFAAEAGIRGFVTMAERSARREEVLAAVTAALATDTAGSWESRLGRLGVPVAAVRTLPEALAAAPDAIVTAGRFRMVGSPVRVAGYDPDYRPPPRLGEHGGARGGQAANPAAAQAANSAAAQAGNAAPAGGAAG